MQMWSSLQNFEQPSSQPLKTIIDLRSLGLLISPYLIFLAFSVTSALYTINNPSDAQPWTGLYCAVKTDAFSRYSVPIFCIVVTVMVITVEGLMVLQICGTRKAVDKATPLMKRESERHSLIRLMLFNVGATLILSCGIFYVVNNLISWPYMAQAGVPLLCVIIFGSQPDILAIWCFWKRTPKPQIGTDLPIPSARADVVCRSATSVMFNHAEVSHRTPV
ncbi:hypothetical protein PM082_003212 [Marasmius tenuissimus]|nr:hypothetical protein PM082_003212 [Marasmius tenuissimus]